MREQIKFLFIHPSHFLLCIKNMLIDFKVAKNFICKNLALDIKDFLIISILTTLATLSTLPLPFLSKDIIDASIAAEKSQQIPLLLLIASAALLFERIISYYHGVVIYRIYRELLKRNRENILENFLKSAYNSNLGGKVITLANEIYQNTEIALSIFFDKLTNVFENILIVIFCFVALLMLDKFIAIGILFFIPFFILSSYYLAKEIRESTEIFYKNMAQEKTFFQSCMENQIFIKLTNIFYPTSIAENKFNRTIFAANNMMHYRSLSFAVVGGITSFFPLLLLAYNVFRIQQGTLSIGSFFATLTIATMMLHNTKQLIIYLQETHPGFAAIKKLNGYYKMEIENVNNKIVYSKFKNIDTIFIKNLEYKFPHSNSQIKNINFQWNRGKIIGLKGKSGGGKTTLSLILNGIIKQTKGSIQFDNVTITPLELQALSILVQQEPLFFDDTVLGNICLGHKKISKEEVSQLLQRFLWEGAQTGIKNRLNEYISEAGKNLSGGEKRRLAIARTLLVENKLLLIFDEPTTGLDSASANAVMAEIKNSANDKFILVISHDDRFDDIYSEIIYLNKD
ncbi:ATP-binding cassette domain-containing protein [Fluviispira sanaruensis]|uniref:ABC transporter ATP-binding protein n=1 Tax=Fluviispira sanaruensis TaxID=2493639 RepID=A0A4P2VLX7_FLUSA|nr:ABC transporter ATP-binding protein [Fluviispira sanaruensis]BBH52830.1 hypothetical protein JCM31447_12730 [Fluviispira sanaruensis]